MYLYHILFTLINICGIDCQKKSTITNAEIQWKYFFSPAENNFGESIILSVGMRRLFLEKSDIESYQGAY
jgi:hypothetical protein